MAEIEKHSIESARRRGSNAMVAAGLSGEDDAAVLGMYGFRFVSEVRGVGNLISL